MGPVVTSRILDWGLTNSGWGGCEFWMRSGSRILEVAGLLRGFVEGCCEVWLKGCCGLRKTDAAVVAVQH